MFSSGLQETSSNEIQFPTISSKVMTIILDFIYLQATSLELMPIDDIWDLCSAAHLLQINPLVEICAKQILKCVSVDNWVTTLTLAKKYSSDILVSAVARCLDGCLPEDKEVSGLDFECFSALITTSSKLKCHSVDVLINLILIWVAHNETDRKKHLVDLFSPLDFSSASGDLVTRLINNNNLFTDSPELLRLLLSKMSLIFSDFVSSKAVTSHPKLLVCFEKAVYSFNFARRQWATFRFSTRCERRNNSLAVTHNAIYFIVYFTSRTSRTSQCITGTGIMAFYPTCNVFHVIDPCETDTNCSVKSNINSYSGIAYLNNSLYVTGGGSTPFLESYDLTLKAWRSHSQPFLLRSQPKIVALSTCIYVFGGCVDESSYGGKPIDHFRAVEKYYKSMDQWTIITMIPNIQLDLATISIVPWQSKLYLSGSNKDEEAVKQCLLVFNPEKNEWTEIMKDFKPEAGGIVSWVSSRSHPPLPYLFMKQDNKYYRIDPETEKSFLIVPGKGELVNEGMPANLTMAVIFLESTTD